MTNTTTINAGIMDQAYEAATTDKLNGLTDVSEQSVAYLANDLGYTDGREVALFVSRYLEALSA